MNMSRSNEIYLDENATTRVLPVAARAAQEAMEELYGNPSSSHVTGLRARHILESTRKLAREVFGATDHQIVFTSGATEAIQTAVFSTLCHMRETCKAELPAEKPRLLLYGATEHKAVPVALRHWNQILGIGAEVLSIPVDSNGLLDLEFLRKHASQADMICTMAVNNETGVIQDLATIEKVIRSENRDVLWLADCVQAVGKMPLDFSSFSVDYVAISGHKIYAPKGVGMLLSRNSAPLTPLIAGGGQEQGIRSGTENLPGVAALRTVFTELAADSSTQFRNLDQLTKFRDRLKDSLVSALPNIVFNTPFDYAVPTTINFAVRGFTSKELLDLFDAADIRVSSGSACGSAVQSSYVLEAMGIPDWQSEGAIRMSFGPAFTEQDVVAACDRIEAAGQALSNSCLIISDTRDLSSAHAIDGILQLKKGSMCTWILFDEASRQCIIIDPFDDFSERIEMFVRCKNAQIVAILDTHNHVDHDSCRKLLMEVLNDYALPSAVDADYLGWPNQIQDKIELGDGAVVACIQFADQVLARTDLNGHTADSQAYLLGRRSDDGRLPASQVRFAILGDTIQIGGIGRSDFKSSAATALYHSLRRLPSIIADQTVICPTHDYSNGFATTLATERGSNPFLSSVLDPIAPISPDAFLVAKKDIDAEINDESNCELVCGRIQIEPDYKSAIDVAPEQLADFFRGHQDALIVDVREPHEYCFEQDWSIYGLEKPPENVPLTEFTNFISRVLSPEGQPWTRGIILVCRSGTRSGKAAEVLRRLGLEHVWHIAGGIALSGRRRTRELQNDVEYAI